MNDSSRTRILPLAVFGACASLAAFLPCAHAQIEFDEVQTIAGPANSERGRIDAAGSAARFDFPSGVVIDPAGNLFVTDKGNSNAVRRITPAGEVTTFAGGNFIRGHADGIGTAAQFAGPEAIARHPSGDLYVADTRNHVIRRITPAGEVTTIAGTPRTAGYANGTGTAARFFSPSGIVIDSTGALFVADQINHVIRRISPTGEVTTFAGLAGVKGSNDGVGTSALFIQPAHLAIDSSDNLYVTELDDVNEVTSTVRKITPAGVVTTLAGARGLSGTADGVGAAARFDSPAGMVVDADGYIYLSDGNARIRRISPTGEVVTVIGMPSLTAPGSRPVYGVLDGPVASAWIKDPQGLAFDDSNNLIIVQHDPSAVRRATALVPAGPVITSQPQDRLTIPTTTVVFEVTATSTASLAFTYRWERAPAGSSTWTAITEDATYGFVTPRMLVVRDTTLAMSGDRFRCIVSNGLPDDAVSDAATLTMQVANQTITFPALADRTYGDAPVVPAASASSGLPVTYTIVSGPAQVSATDTLVLTGAGSVTVRASQGGDGVAITPAVDVERTFLVAKKALVATAVDATRTRGFNNPVLTVSYTGFVGSDSATVLDTPPVAATAAVASSPVGTYAITLSGGSDDNYSFDLRAGTLSVVPGYTVRTWAGSRESNADPWRAGAGRAARLETSAIALDAAGGVYAAGGGVISQISRDGEVTLFAGSPDATGHLDGPRLSARFEEIIRGLFFDAAGRLLVVEEYHMDRPGGGGIAYPRVRRVGTDGTVTTVYDSQHRPAGEPGFGGSAIARDSVGRLYSVFDGRIIQLELGVGAIVAHDVSGREGASGSLLGLAIDGAGNFYVAELNGEAIWKVTPSGEISIFAGSPGDSRRVDGPRLEARFKAIRNLAAAPDGSLWIGDDASVGINGSNVIRRISADGQVVSVAGDATIAGAGITQVDGVGDAARLWEPSVFAFRDDGVVFWGTTWSGSVLAAVEVAAAPTFTIEPEDRIVISATSVTFHAAATGRPPPGYQWQRSSDGGANWIDLVDDATYADVTGPTLTVRGVDAAMDGVRFRVVADNVVDPPAVSRAAVLRVAGSGGTVFTGGFSASGATATAHLARAHPALAAEGEWALFVGGDGAARFIARPPGGAEAVVQAFSVAADGTFSAPGRTILFSNGARESGAAYVLTGAITGGVLTARLDGLGLVFGGAAFSPAGPTAAFAAHYAAVGLGAGLSELHVVVAPDGTARVLLLGRDGLDGGGGTINAEGVLSAVLDSGATLTATVDLGALGIRASVTPTGPGAQVVEYAGLSALGRAESRVVNLSARTRTDAGDRVSIIGFVLQGAGTRRLLIRGVGPTLGSAPFGVAGALADPSLILHDATGAPALAIDDWGERGDAAELAASAIQAGAFALPAGSADAAALVELPAGAHTVFVSGADATAGVVLGELYTLDGDDYGPHLVNLSSRAFVGPGSAVAIPGIVSTGNVPRRFLIRAVGPTLAGPPFAVGEALADPLLRIYRGEVGGRSTLLHSNDDWGATPDAQTTAQVAQQVGAFALSPGSKDAALVLTLAPGVYTMHGTSADGTSTGVILVEVFVVP